MSHRIDVRLPDDLYLELKECPGKVSYNVVEALRSYVRDDVPPKTYNVELVSSLQAQIVDLRRDKEFLQVQLMARQPLLQRLILRLKGRSE